jgi:catechol 2,3-dioxygenase-like lactoylglutathione lyase family enzyme
MRIVVSMLVLALTRPLAAQAAPAPAFSATGAFFALSVGDVDASAKWYAEQLGLHEVMRPPKANGASVVVLEGGGLTVELVQHDGSASMSQDAAKVHGFFKVGLEVSDFDHALAVFRERGVTIAYGPYPASATQRANAIIRDNAGNLIQIFGRASDQAIVAGDSLTVIFPITARPAAAWTSPGNGPTRGSSYYQWRFGTNGSSGFVAGASVDPGDPDAANARGSLEAVVKHLTLRKCEPQGHILVCAQPIAGSVRTAEDRVIVTVLDPAIVRLLLNERAPYLWRTMVLPDTIIGPDSVRVHYIGRE